MDNPRNFRGTKEQLKAFGDWIDELTCSVTARSIDDLGKESYTADLNALNKALSTGCDHLECLNPTDAQECSMLIRGLQREVSLVLASGLSGIIEPTPEQQRAAERCQELLGFLVPHFERLGVRIRRELGKESVAEKAADKGMPWQEAATRMLEMMNRGDPFTSQKKLGDQIGCSSFTINKAIQRTPALSTWSEKQHGSATGMQNLDEIALDNIAEGREGDPSEVLEPDDTDAALRYLLEQADPEEQAKIHAMDPAERRTLAETVYRDKDYAEQLWRWRSKLHKD